MKNVPRVTTWYFTNEEKEYIRTHYTTQTIYQMATALGRVKSSVGYQVNTVLKLKIPADVYAKNKQARKDAADTRKAKKILNAVKKRQIRKFKERVGKPHFQKSENQTKKEINWCKKKLQQPAVKIADHSNLIPLRINHKTTIYIKPGTDIEAVKSLYNN